MSYYCVRCRAFTLPDEDGDCQDCGRPVVEIPYTEYEFYPLIYDKKGRFEVGDETDAIFLEDVLIQNYDYILHVLWDYDVIPLPPENYYIDIEIDDDELLEYEVYLKENDRKVGFVSQRMGCKNGQIYY